MKVHIGKVGSIGLLLLLGSLNELSSRPAPNLIVVVSSYKSLSGLSVVVVLGVSGI